MKTTNKRYVEDIYKIYSDKKQEMLRNNHRYKNILT